MEHEYLATDYIQEDFFHLLPGFAGGRALRDQRGAEYFRRLAWLSAERPEHERQQAARNASITRLRRLYTVPRTIQFLEMDELITERVVPWWPHQKNRQRRKRPVFVRIELERMPVGHINT